MDSQIAIMENEFGKQTQKIDFYLNSVNQFVENGCEVNQDTIELREWWVAKERRYTHKIYFKRDYSSRPLLFFSANKLKYFSVKNLPDTELKRNVVIWVELKKLMTTYFTVEVVVQCNEKVNEDSVNKTFVPYLQLVYVVFNRSDA